VPEIEKKNFLQDILAPNEKIKFPSDYMQWKMNGSQRGALETALRRRLAIIQGPPGTGKKISKRTKFSRKKLENFPIKISRKLFFE
jgi:hypothetical protein